MRLDGNGKCKVCRSPYREQIDRMIIEGVPYSEIIRAFPDLRLNKANISNHKKHILPEVKEDVTKKYKDHIETLGEIVVDELTALDSVISKAFRIFQTFDESSKPRSVEVWGSILLRAIKLKKEIFSKTDPVEKFLDDLFSGLEEEVESYG